MPSDQLTTLELSRGFILPALDITVQESTIRFKRLIPLEMGPGARAESHSTIVKLAT